MERTLPEQRVIATSTNADEENAASVEHGIGACGDVDSGSMSSAENVLVTADKKVRFMLF